MADQQYSKREQILIAALNYLWRQAGENWISPGDVQRVVMVAERLLARERRRNRANITTNGVNAMSNAIRFNYGDQEVVLDQTNVAAVIIGRGDTDDEVDPPFVLSVVVSGSADEIAFYGEFSSMQEAIAIRDRILNACQLQGWFKFQDGEDEIALDRWEVSDVEVLKDDIDGDLPYLTVFNKKGAPLAPLYVKSSKTRKEALALQKAFLDGQQAH